MEAENLEVMKAKNPRKFDGMPGAIEQGLISGEDSLQANRDPSGIFWQ